MASVTTRPNGHRWVTFRAPSGKRQTIRLGPASASQADAFKVRVERLLVAKRLGEVPDVATVEWLAGLSDDLHDKLSKCGLCNTRGARTVGELVAWYIETHPHWKTSTLCNVKVCGDSLVRYFGRERRITLITSDDAFKYRDWLERAGRSNGGPLAKVTASRMAKRAKGIFNPAVKRRWIPENPFAELTGWLVTNPERDEYITTNEFEKVMSEATADTRLFFSLTRYAALRGYSETMPLEWTWIDWAHRTMFVKAPKTARHEGQASRFVPLGDHLYSLLLTASENAPIGARYVFGETQITNAAFDNRLEAACRRARIIMWPKPKVNLRASCEYDWLRNHQLDEVAAWCGHSPETMLRHYNRVAKEQSARNASSALHAQIDPLCEAQKAKRQNRSRRTDMNDSELI